jgi:hypothetical protein
MDEEIVDHSAALASISEGLGFNADTNEDAAALGGPGDDKSEAVVTSKEAPATTTAPAKPAGTAPAANVTAAPAAPSAPVAPKTWRPEAAAAFATLPPNIQAEIHKREEDMFRGLEQYRSAAQFGQSLHKSLEPYLPTLQQYRIDPAVQVAGLMKSHHTLALGTPQEKVALMTTLFRDYGIDLQSVATALDPGNAPYIDPAVRDLTQTVQTLQSQIAKQTQERLAEHQTKLRSQVDAFATNPANAYFNEVANDMAVLIDKGVCSTMEEAYEKAIWANPVTRAKEAARLAAEQAETTRKAAAERTSAVRRSLGANVRTIPKSGSATAPVGSIDDTLRDTMAAIKARG